MSTGRMHPPHLQQIGGSYENGTNHNKETGNTSSVDHSLFSKLVSFARIAENFVVFCTRTDMCECRARDGV